MLKPVLQPQRPTERQYLSVSQLNRMAKSELEKQLGHVWLQGEISNFSAPASGHWYFSLKDQQAQVRCAMFKGRNRLLRFRPEDGQQVIVKARVTLYEARGEFQLVADIMEPAGVGALQLQFEQLKNKLAAAGLFDEDGKRPIPTAIKTLGIITSPTGAAIRDVLTVMERRFPLTEIIIYPAQVQGKDAHNTIIQALETANQRNECDALLLTRGGGSMEDLWCFNEESLAYAITNSSIPVVSAVGHEVDFTIADFVADSRAPTPSAAAEMLSRDQQQQRQTLDNYQMTLQDLMLSHIESLATHLNFLALKLADPDPILDKYQSAIQQLSARMNLFIEKKINTESTRLEQQKLHLSSLHPDKQLSSMKKDCHHLSKRLIQAMETQLNQQHQQLIHSAQRLHTVSPLATLDRGYSITLKDDVVVKSCADVNTGDIITTKLKDGVVTSQVQ
ncbi:exodeoxyribonuclease VII large subunit [Pleionea sp. CnH1-48]|uniref:exodeoxyribonuclease VII large subunit n=1 Tax=Pleionea sp. CnH1-48 TaxID=2954494 RepID=UPI002097E6FB|nr:exodeoxyribonuclease VII large subunit [Pleionea sp. CnH1-48]MCO7227447.1 exodeoxyribonuclease VII large subunit [Pleionea sp. CnH1-48]